MDGTRPRDPPVPGYSNQLNYRCCFVGRSLTSKLKMKGQSVEQYWLPRYPKQKKASLKREALIAVWTRLELATLPSRDILTN